MIGISNLENKIMKLIKGSRTGRRYIVNGELEGEVLVEIQKNLKQFSFEKPAENNSTDEKLGFVQAKSFLKADFDLLENFFVSPYVFGQFRVDVKKLSGNLYKARLNEKVEEWLIANKREKIFKKTKDELADALKFEMYSQTLPTVKTVEFCWNIDQGYILFLSTSTGINQKFVEYFYQSFGLSLTPFTPLMFLAPEDENIEKITKCARSSFRARSIDSIEKGE